MAQWFNAIGGGTPKTPIAYQNQILTLRYLIARRRCARGKAKIEEDAEAERDAMYMHSFIGSLNPKSLNKSNRCYSVHHHKEIMEGTNGD
ncbi:hypothetical protein QYF36_003709 [Acer negundo]|nr:hypothetical protein QYF36_003709 [Acer negundo]